MLLLFTESGLETTQYLLEGPMSREIMKLKVQILTSMWKLLDYKGWAFIVEIALTKN
ncbi:MAG: hypothetical protein ACRD8Z_09765 [Nitrososphaeraceae archaeon]